MAADWFDGSGTGYSMAYANSFGASALTTALGLSSKRNLAATSGVPTVAERATSWYLGATFLSRCNPTESWTPLLLSTRL